jgi:ABC-type phosphate transport system auxiliary subunit
VIAKKLALDHAQLKQQITQQCNKLVSESAITIKQCIERVKLKEEAYLRDIDLESQKQEKQQKENLESSMSFYYQFLHN